MLAALKTLPARMADRLRRSAGALMSLNDPNWGRRGGNSGGGGNNSGGPPDLDDLLRNFNRKLSGLLGRKPAGRNDGPPDEGGGAGGGFARYGGGAGIIAGLLILFWVFSGFYIVGAGERGVVTRFGKYLETTSPGPRWHLPYPVEAVDVVNISQVRTLELGFRNKAKVPKEALMLTDDENIVDIQFTVQYTLKSAEDYLFNDRSPDEAVVQAAETAMREIVGKSSMDFVLYEGREQVAVQATKLIQEILDRYKTGIQVSKVNLQNAQPPEQVQAAFDDANRAVQDRERAKNEGQAYANDVIPKARGNAARLKEEADGYRQRVVERAEGDAARFRSIATEYVKAPGVTRDRLYLEAMQDVLQNSSKVLVDQKQGGGSLLYLPLDKLIQQSGPSASGNLDAQRTAPAAAESAPAVEAPAAGARARDSGFRSRDREPRP
ncbi:MAG: FtsH protease activity modulator HflK [Burkholderiales bacterium]